MFAVRNPILLGAVMVLSAVVVWLSVAQISRFIRFGGLPQVATRLDAGEAVSRASITSLVSDADALREADICQGVFLKSGFTILLASVDMVDRAANRNAWSEAVRRADTFALHALGCIPTNGDFWLKLAMLRQAVSEKPEELAELLTDSQLYAPAEGNIVAARYALYNRLTDQTLALIPDAVSADIRIICSKSGDAIRGRLTTPSPAISRVMKTISPGCDPISGQS